MQGFFVFLSIGNVRHGTNHPAYLAFLVSDKNRPVHDEGIISIGHHKPVFLKPARQGFTF